MKAILSIVFSLALASSFSQKLGNGYVGLQGANAVSNLNTSAQESRIYNQLQSLNQIEPIGANQFRNDYNTGWQTVRFEVYPNPAHNWLAADFPANRNIRFVRILDIAGQVVATYHMWDRQFYIGNLQSGMYVVQFVQNNFYAHSTPFFKR